MENSNPLAKIENVSFRYPKSDADALSGVSLEIPRGSFFALLGPNGATVRAFCEIFGHD